MKHSMQKYCLKLAWIDRCAIQSLIVIEGGCRSLTQTNIYLVDVRTCAYSTQ